MTNEAMERGVLYLEHLEMMKTTRPSAMLVVRINEARSSVSLAIIVDQFACAAEEKMLIERLIIPIIRIAIMKTQNTFMYHLLLKQQNEYTKGITKTKVSDIVISKNRYSEKNTEIRLMQIKSGMPNFAFGGKRLRKNKTIKSA